MKILHLTLKKKWFDMIASGEKKEEYREVKPYWEKRLGTKGWINAGTPSCSETYHFHKWDIVRFRNGYAKDAPTMDVEFRHITKCIGFPKWGAVGGVEYFTIQLGKVLSVSDPFHNVPHYSIP